MPHTIADADVERLSRLAGVRNLDEWKSQLVDQKQRIRDQLDGNVETAWANCLPTWLTLGRVKDLSQCVRVPKYWPSYANNLGLAFVEKFRGDFAYIVNMLRESPNDSYEFLCALDLLAFIARDADPSETHLFDELYGIDCPLPSVIQLETANDARYAGISNVGELLRRSRDLD